MRLQATGVGHLGDLPSIFFDGKLVQGERSSLVLDLQVPLIDPHRHVFPGQPPLAIKAPVLELHEAVAINQGSVNCVAYSARESTSSGKVRPNTPRSTSEGLCRPSCRAWWA